jgi:hypothetical protein
MTQKVMVGLLGRVLNATKPTPTHSISYPPWMGDAPTMKKARKAVKAGRGPRKVVKGPLRHKG